MSNKVPTRNPAQNSIPKKPANIIQEGEDTGGTKRVQLIDKTLPRHYNRAEAFHRSVSLTFTPGQQTVKRVTIYDVAERAGVGLGTVSAVVNRSSFVSETLTQRVTEAITELGYSPNGIARSLRRRSTQTIGVLISTIVSPFFPPVLREIEQSLAREGFSILFANTEEDQETEARLISLMQEKQVDGLLMVPDGQANLHHVQRLAARGVPVVTFHSDLGKSQFDCVHWDDYGGSYNATQHLIGMGRRRVAVVASQVPSVQARLPGYKAALQQAGLLIDPCLQLISSPDEYYSRVDWGRDVLLRALHMAHPPDAVLIAASSYLTLGLFDSAKAAGVRIPEDLAVVAYDDFPWSAYLTPPLSVVRRDPVLLASTAVELLLRRLKGELADHPETITLPTELIVRASSG